jgi:hypothetical protein
MRTPNIFKLTVVTFAAFMAFGCSRPFLAIAPEGFASYEGGSSFKFVSPDHVVFRVRSCTNDPYAGFDFWREALPERMKNAGYRIIADSVMTTENNKALLIEMAAPLGAVDFSYMVMMRVKEKKILIAEAAGEFADLQKRKPAVIAALNKAVFK